ncbi:MAG: hypothetical protein EBT69_09835 [Verrucomicrobia bacterium]|nr:hypothetical protein [Verrucomicrobiota bacterium]
MPTVPLAVAALEMTGAVTAGAAAIVMLKALVPEPAEFVALRVTADVAAALGVPEISPLVALTVRPAGSPVAL